MRPIFPEARRARRRDEARRRSRRQGRPAIEQFERRELLAGGPRGIGVLPDFVDVRDL